jgi:hypothetical protein
MKYLIAAILFTTLLACGGEPGFIEPGGTRTEVLTSTTWEVNLVNGSPYDWESFYKIYYTFTDTEVEMVQYDAQAKEIKLKSKGKWHWEGTAEIGLHLDFRLQNGNGNQYYWELRSLEDHEFLFKSGDDHYLLIPKK